VLPTTHENYSTRKVKLNLSSIKLYVYHQDQITTNKFTQTNSKQLSSKLFCSEILLHKMLGWAIVSVKLLQRGNRASYKEGEGVDIWNILITR